MLAPEVLLAVVVGRITDEPGMLDVGWPVVTVADVSVPLGVCDTTVVGRDVGGSEVTETEEVTGGGEVMLVVGGGTMPLMMED